MIGGVLIACLFRTGHRMAAGKGVSEILAFNLLVNAGFGAAYIGNEGPRLQVWPEGGQILGCLLYTSRCV